jgi:hypothetical protein
MGDLATLFMIEGISIDLSPFAILEKDKTVIIRKLIANNNGNRNKGLLKIVEAY